MSQDRTPILETRDLRVQVGDKAIVKGVDLKVYPGEKHAVMGPNGSGKSTFAAALMGHPSLEVQGEILLGGVPIQDLEPHERARRGMFLGFQYPVAVPGVPVANFLRAAAAARRGEEVPAGPFRKELFAAFEELEIPREFAIRYLNDGFSGGEKKRLEILQLAMLKPTFALLDEIDSGLDIDALRLVSGGINRAVDDGVGVLLVTHYQRILDYVKPDHVHVFMDGKVVRSGGAEQALELERIGYESFGHAEGAGVTP